jgi:hypothetical protein
MTVINNPSKQMQNGDNVTVYNNTVGTVTETFTFPTSQETIILSNKGSKNITYTIGANTGTLTPSTFVKVIGAFSSFSLSSEQGTQAFEVWSEEAGTLGVTPEAVQSLGNQVSGFSGQLGDLTTQLAESASIDADLVVTVGTGGNYATINEAIAYLSKRKLKYAKTGLKAEILLKSGFVMTEQVYVKNVNLGFITISSEDAEVSINASGFVENVTETAYGASGFALGSSAAFTGYGNATIPVINVLFNFNQTGISGRTNGIFLVYGANGRVARGKGFKNGLSNGYSVMEGSRLYATDTICTGHNGNNISCYRGSYILFRAGIATGSVAGYGAYLDNASTIDCISGDFSTNALGGLWISGLSFASANRITANNNVGNGITADSGSIVDAHNSTILNSSQRGIQCDGATVNVNDAVITGSGSQSINITNNGNVTAKNANLTGAKATNAVYVNGGGSCNISNATCQKVVGTDGSDIRVGTGGIIYAHGATGGFSGATPNSLSNNGIIFNASAVTDNSTFGADQTFTPTGDWTGTLTYSKTANGMVWLRGTLTAGTTLVPGTNIGSIATGYRPPNAMPIRSIHGTNNTSYSMHISSSGGFYLSDTLVAGTYSINVLYKVN